MRIQSTVRPNRPLRDALRVAESRVVAPTGEPAVGFAAVAGGLTNGNPAALRGAVVGWPVAGGQSFDSFMDTREFKLARGLWSQIAPAVPAHLRNGVQAAWIVLDATALLARYQSLPPLAGPAEIVELALDGTALGLKALSFANKTAGYAGNAAEIDSVGLLLRYGRSAAQGKDVTWMVTQDRLNASSPVYKAATGYLGLLETALGTKDLAVRGGRWLVSDPPSPSLAPYLGQLEPGAVTRISAALQEQAKTP